MHQPLPIIPKPDSVTFQAGFFVIDTNAAVSSPPGAERAADLIQKLTGLASIAHQGQIRFVLKPTIRGEEAYHLDVDESGIEIRASSTAGLFYGAQTLRQLLPAGVENGTSAAPYEIPYLHIEDAPRFPYRGFMLDVSRHYFGVDEIKRMLDLLALHKMNRLHWHLTDDQGWRIEIKQYPRLVEVGSLRKETQVAGWLLSKPVYDGKPYAGYYTQAEIREVVAYAAKNFIEVIPEIGSPGHFTAAMAAYPQLSCAGMPVEVRTSVTTFSKPLCVGNEFVFEFLENVFSEIVDLFPSGYIHIGGDEVNKKEWKKCPHCQRRMVAEGLKNGHDLQAYFENRLAALLKARGSRIIAWSEVLHDNLDPEIINQFWFFANRRKTIAELKKGRKTIVSDFSRLYLDYSYRVMELIRTYQFEPQFAGINAVQASSILGIEAPLWTEYVASRARMDWQTFPRITALSETAWTPKDGRDYDDFLVRLAYFEKRLDALGVQHATRECYLKHSLLSKIPFVLKVLFSGEHPGEAEYKQFHQPT